MEYVFLESPARKAGLSFCLKSSSQATQETTEIYSYVFVKTDCEHSSAISVAVNILCSIFPFQLNQMYISLI